jgi:hypothetical protein
MHGPPGRLAGGPRGPRAPVRHWVLHTSAVGQNEVGLMALFWSLAFRPSGRNVVEADMHAYNDTNRFAHCATVVTTGRNSVTGPRVPAA